MITNTDQSFYEKILNRHTTNFHWKIFVYVRVLFMCFDDLQGATTSRLGLNNEISRVSKLVTSQIKDYIGDNVFNLILM